MKEYQAQLVVPVDDEATAWRGAVAWFEQALETFGERFRERLAEGETTDLSRCDGAPGDLRAYIYIRQSEDADPDVRGYSSLSRQWLAESLMTFPRDAALYINTFDHLGIEKHPSLCMWLYTIYGNGRGWLVLTTVTDDESLVDTLEGQANLRGYLRTVAGMVNPTHGEICYAIGGVSVALQHALFEPTEPSVLRSGRELRSYSWVTVLGAPLYQRLGGIEALRSSNAFFDVSPMPSGAVLLQATPDWRDFDIGAANRIFEVLAPVLPDGLPKDRSDRNVVALRDPRDLRSGQTRS